MKKIIIYFIISLVFLVPLTSCVNKGDSEKNKDGVYNKDNPYIPMGLSTWETIDNPDSPKDERLAIDTEKETLPSYFDLKAIKEQSTLEEVYNVAGLPQRVGLRPTAISSITPLKSYIYDTREGISYEVIYGVKISSDAQIQEIGVYDVNVIYPENGEFIALAIIILFIILFSATVVIIIRKKKKAAGTTAPQPEQTA